MVYPEMRLLVSLITPHSEKWLWCQIH